MGRGSTKCLQGVDSWNHLRILPAEDSHTWLWVLCHDVTYIFKEMRGWKLPSVLELEVVL